MAADRDKPDAPNEAPREAMLRERLRRADRLSAVTRLASNMAHELGTPLNVVTGRASMIAMDETLPPAARENAEIVIQQAERMSGLIRELLMLVGREDLEPTQHRVGDAIEDSLTLLQPVYEARGLSIDKSGDLDSQASFDYIKIVQVLTHVLMNAVEAMPDGGHIQVHVSRAQLDMPSARHAGSGNYVCIDVSDTGTGIASENLERIFRPFFTSVQKGGGSGLGLAICRGIIREHGGWIEAESDVGRGTVIKIRFPLGSIRDES